MKKPKVSPEVQAAVITALLAGQSVSQVAKEYSIPKGTISSWKNRKVAKVAQSAATDATDATQKSQMIGDRLHELVVAGLAGFITIAKLPEDREWVKAQSAHELGVFAGILCDKSIRILEAMGGDGVKSDTPVAANASGASSASIAAPSTPSVP